jgi:hypothetical protein
MQDIRRKQNEEAAKYSKSISMQIRGKLQNQLDKYEQTDTNNVDQTKRNYGKQPSQLDMESVMNVDRAMELIVKNLTDKVSSLEFLLSEISASQSTDSVQRAYSNIVEYNNFIIAYNNVIRSYQKVGLSNSSRNIIAVKLEKLTPQLDSLVYALNELINYYFANGRVDKTIFAFLKSLAVYTFAKNSIFRNNYILITQDYIDVTYQEIISSFSESRRELLDEFVNADITNKPLGKIPQFQSNIKDEIKQFEEELGFIPIAEKQKIKSLPPKIASDFLKTYKNKANEITNTEEAYETKKQTTVDEFQEVSDKIDNLTLILNNLEAKKLEVEENMRDIDTEEIIKLQEKVDAYVSEFEIKQEEYKLYKENLKSKKIKLTGGITKKIQAYQKVLENLDTKIVSTSQKLSVRKKAFSTLSKILNKIEAAIAENETLKLDLFKLQSELDGKFHSLEDEKEYKLEIERKDLEKYTTDIESKVQPFNKFSNPTEELQNRISVIEGNPVQTVKDQKLLLKLQAELEKLQVKTDAVDEKIEDLKFDGDGMHYNEKRNNVYLLKRPKRILIQ